MAKLSREDFGIQADCGVAFADFASALQVWVFCQPGMSPTVRAAADAFNVTDCTIRLAAEESYWMFVDGPNDDPTKQTLELEGE